MQILFNRADFFKAFKQAIYQCKINNLISAKQKFQFASEIPGRGLEALLVSISSATLNVGVILPILDYCRHPSPMMIG
jgi:hypothetical protein